MTFGEKYELQESLTTGGVETFVAHDKIRGQQVLVHILHCDPQKPNQPTVHWVLESFRRVAPEPAALVLETGQYSGTLYAYLVTKLPEKVALDRWVQEYEDQSRETQDLPAIIKPTPESEAPTADLPGKGSGRIPGPMTQLLQAFDQQAKPLTPSNPAKEEQPPSQPPQTLPPLVLSPERSGAHKAPVWDLEIPAVLPTPKAEPTISNPTSSFRSDFKTKDFAPESISPDVPAGPNPGEFTSFFQGPFRGDSPSEIPSLSPQPMEPPRKTVGDFTAVFGSVKAQPEEPLPTSGIAGNEPAGSGFTGWFKPDLPSRPSGTAMPPATSGLPRAAVDPPTVVPSVDPFAPASPAPSMSQVAPPPPVLHAPAMSNPSLQTPAGAGSAATPPDGATRAFSRPVIQPAPSQAEIPSGPSAYTQIISVRPRIASGDAARDQKEAPSKPATPPVFATPAMPPLPTMPAPPPLPALAMPPKPAMPTVAAPPLPPIAKAAQAEVSPPAVSYWPLILTLTVLFFAAVLLVLYFVLKH